MAETPITTDPHHSVLLPIEQVDSTGTPLDPQDASYTTLTLESSNTAAVQITGDRAIFGGTYGTSTITATETSTDSTKPAITDTIDITFQGPPAAALKINAQVVLGN